MWFAVGGPNFPNFLLRECTEKENCHFFSIQINENKHKRDSLEPTYEALFTLKDVFLSLRVNTLQKLEIN